MNNHDFNQQSAQASSSSVEVVTSIEDLEAISQEWEELVFRTKNPELFLTPQFMTTWWKTEGKDQYPNATLNVLVFRVDQRLVGIAPVFLSSDHLYLLGCADLSDYLDVLIDGSYQNQVTDKLVQTLEETTFSKAKWCSLSKKSEVLTAVLPKLSDQYKTNVSLQDVCPVIDLPSTWEEYLQLLDRKQRHEVRRKWRKLEQETRLEFEVLTSSTDVSTHTSDFIRLHKASSHKKAAFWNQARETFFYELLKKTTDKNWLRLYFAKVDRKRVASMLVFDFNQSYYLYNSGFDTNYSSLSVGQVLTSFTIQDAILNQKKRYDFLRGDEVYKFRLGGVAQSVFDLEFSRKR